MQLELPTDAQRQNFRARPHGRTPDTANEQATSVRYEMNATVPDKFPTWNPVNLYAPCIINVGGLGCVNCEIYVRADHRALQRKSITAREPPFAVRGCFECLRRRTYV